MLRRRCSQAFVAHRDSFVNALNDAIAEQYHSFIQHGRQQLGGMNQANFMFSMEVLMRRFNVGKHLLNRGLQVGAPVVPPKQRTQRGHKRKRY